MKDVIDHQEMVKKRHDQQVTIAKKKGRSSTEEFRISDRVIIQDNNDHKWRETGTIVGERKADDLSIQSYEIKMDSGNTKLRNKRFIRHHTKGLNVQFQSPQLQGPPHGNSGQRAGHGKADQVEAESSERTASPPRTRSRARAAQAQ